MSVQFGYCYVTRNLRWPLNNGMKKAKCLLKLNVSSSYNQPVMSPYGHRHSFCVKWDVMGCNPQRESQCGLLDVTYIQRSRYDIYHLIYYRIQCNHQQQNTKQKQLIKLKLST